MVVDKFNMVDMEGIDIIENQGVEIPGLYQKLVDSIAQCRYQCLYNWKSDGVNIPPSFVELVVDPDTGNILINTGIYVTPEDVIMSDAFDAGDILYDPSATYQNGTVGAALTDAQSMIATVEVTATASKNYAISDLLVLDGKLYEVTSSIAIGDTIIIGSNVIQTTVEDQIGSGESSDSTVTLYETAELGEDIDLIEIPLPAKYKKIFIRFMCRINNAANDLANTTAYCVCWLGNSTTLDSAAQSLSTYFNAYIRQSDIFMTKSWFDVDYPYVERYTVEPYGATNWSATANIKSVDGSYNIPKIADYPTTLYIRPYETNRGYLFKANSKLCVYAVI